MSLAGGRGPSISAGMCRLIAQRILNEESGPSSVQNRSVCANGRCARVRTRVKRREHERACGAGWGEGVAGRVRCAFVPCPSSTTRKRMADLGAWKYRRRPPGDVAPCASRLRPGHPTHRSSCPSLKRAAATAARSSSTRAEQSSYASSDTCESWLPRAASTASLWPPSRVLHQCSIPGPSRRRCLSPACRGQVATSTRGKHGRSAPAT
mmetsp:Transcript_28682/g.77208  ORF Transcript_28682/g.77208 Transcript_28682/m.77208 type:complete len:209 (-) Transcript_28682:862-1488(-)